MSIGTRFRLHRLQARVVALTGVLAVIAIASRVCAASGAMIASAIIVERPGNYEVFQRTGGGASVPIRITGASSAHVQIAVADASRHVVARCRLDSAGGIAEGDIQVPQGGWYSLRVGANAREAAANNGPPLATFGVGDVFVVAGQSNAAGYGNGSIPDRTGLVSVMSAAGGWVLADTPQGLPEGMASGSPWPILGGLLSTFEHVPIGFINVAVGGTSTVQWLPNGSLYPALKAALAGRGVRAVLWHQGESDASAELSTEQTYENMGAIISQSRADAGWSVPWYVALASYLPSTSTGNQQATRLAQKNIIAAGLASAGPDTDTYIPPAMRHDGVHFNEVGLKTHAVLWFEALEIP